MRNKRRFTRIKVRMRADVISSRSGFRGRSLEVKDLSIKGAFIVSIDKPPVGDLLDIVLKLTADGSTEMIEVKGEVVRTSDEGFGVLFKEIELGEFAKLKTFIMLNIENSEVIEEDLKHITE